MVKETVAGPMTKAPPPCGDGAFGKQHRRSVLRGGVRRGPVAPIRHELVELGLVLGHAQAVEECAELALLFLEPAQGFRPVLVKSAVAAGGMPRRAVVTALL